MGVVALHRSVFALVALGMGIAGVNCQPAARGTSLERRVMVADGKVIRVDHTSGIAFISLTKADRVTPGLTFFCLTPSMDKHSGTLEVIEAGERFSVCRVVSSSENGKIGAGDLLFNGAFHAMRGKKLRFVIGGGFDLNADGAVTGAEREQLERMIVSWGGQVDPEITVWTNYLILGQFPAEPSIEEKPVVPYGIVDERHKVQGSYAAMEAAAKHWAVPVLNQNRALILRGYYAVADRE
jgi:hypothetical protein